MHRARFALAALLCAALLTPTAPAQTSKQPAKQPARKSSLNIPYKLFTLKNGLRVILSEDHSAPTVSVSVTYDVGSRDERKGRTGFAHLFEHMMFQGSENVGKGEHFILVDMNGGGVNGTTNNDRTLYFETLPANQLDLGLFIEADRMKSLAITQANLDNQRKAVQEERRLRVDNQPYGKTFEARDETAYDNFAYKHSVIGSMEDLSAATLQDVAEFFKIYYAPNNAVLALVGDFKTEEALAKVKKYFEAIPAQKKPAPVDMTEPPQTAERRKELEDGFARVPRLDILYKIPPSNTHDWYALDVAGDVLVRGQSSRLYQKLVREKQLAVGVFGGPDARRGPSIFSFVVQARANADLKEIEKIIYEEIARVQKEPVSEEEIAKIYMQNKRTFAQQLQGSLGRAIQFSDNTVMYNDPNLINTWLDKYSKVNAKEIQRVAQTYWKDNNRTVITTVPKGQTPARPAAGDK
jgi:predicted Zn-dependent peptidase